MYKSELGQTGRYVISADPLVDHRPLRESIDMLDFKNMQVKQ
jgi:hypothetical protein